MAGHGHVLQELRRNIFCSNVLPKFVSAKISNNYLDGCNTLRNQLQTANKILCETWCSDLHYVSIGSKVQNIVFVSFWISLCVSAQQ
jgi:hypothetical protein